MVSICGVTLACLWEAGRWWVGVDEVISESLVMVQIFYVSIRVVTRDFILINTKSFSFFSPFYKLIYQVVHL